MFRTLRLLALPLALSLAFTGCGSDSTGPARVSIETTVFAPSLDVELAAMNRTESGLYFRDLAPGTGAVVTAGQTIAVHYAGWLADGTQFDANGADEPPAVFRIGVGQVIAGWDQGVVGMRVGGQRQLVIPPELGYGSRRNGPIPGNSVLVFTVEVVSAQ